MHRTWTSSGVALLAALWLQAGERAATPSGRPDLTGRWQLNKAESEDALAKLQAAGGLPRGPGERGGRGFPGGGFPGGGGRPVGGRRGGLPGGPGGPGGPARPGGPGGEIREFLEPAQTLTITGNDAELTFDDGEGNLTRLHVDGKPYKREGGSVLTKAEWKGQSLVVESRSERGGKLTSTYRLLPETSKLEISSRFEGRREPLTVKRVYDGVSSDTARSER